jgi:hypothetical protein
MRAGVVCAAVATTATLLVTAQGASSAAPTKSFAYGLSINGEGKQPYIESTDGSTQSQGGEIPQNPLLYGGVVSLSAGDDQASIEVANLTAGEALQELPPELTDQLDQLTAACEEVVDPVSEEIPDILGELPIGGVEQPTSEEIVAFCNDLLDGAIPNLAELDALEVSCDGDSGDVTIAGLRVLGAEVPLLGTIPENTTVLPAESPVQITLNRQTANKDGSFTVDGIVATLGPDGEGEIILGSTTCGVPIAQDVNNPNPNPPPAPTPTPVPTSAPVTG